MIRSGFFRGSAHDLRRAFDPGGARPAYAAGLRAAVATVAPLIVDPFLHTGGAAWMSLAGLNGALIDRGGPYRARAAVMGALALASAVAVLAGSLSAGHSAVALVLTFVLAVLCGLTRAWTDVGPGFGVTILVTYVIALAVPAAGIGAALTRAAFVLIGGAWAMVIALMLWPLRPYRPVRIRVAACFRAIGDYADAAAAATLEDPAHDPRRFHQQRLDIRAALEAARAALATSRRGRAAETGRGERLLVLEEIADQLFAHLIVLLEESHIYATQQHDRVIAPNLAAILRQLGATTHGLAAAIETEDDTDVPAVSWSGHTLEAAIGLPEIVDRMADYAANASAVIASLNGGAEDDLPRELGAPPAPERRLFTLDAIVHPDSIVLRHALRVAVVTTAAVAIAEVLHLNHGYWVTLTVIVILQPYGAATRVKALQRVVGTVLGGIVAAALSALFHSAIAVFVLIAVFTMLCVALLPINYGAYAVFGTPAFVLLAEAGAQDWHLAGTRIVNTLIGGALALLGMRLLWPTPEWTHLPRLIAKALTTEAEYLAQALGALRGEKVPLAETRRRLAHDALEAEESFQRLLSERRGGGAATEPLMAALTYLRRMASTIAGLAVVPPALAAESSGHVREPAEAARAVLLDLSASLLEGRAPSELPRLRAPSDDVTIPPILRDRLTRLIRQTRVLHDAVARCVTPRPS